MHPRQRGSNEHTNGLLRDQPLFTVLADLARLQMIHQRTLNRRFAPEIAEGLASGALQRAPGETMKAISSAISSGVP